MLRSVSTFATVENALPFQVIADFATTTDEPSPWDGSNSLFHLPSDLSAIALAKAETHQSEGGVLLLLDLP